MNEHYSNFLPLWLLKEVVVVRDAVSEDGGDNCKSFGLEDDDDEFIIDGDELKNN